MRKVDFRGLRIRAILLFVLVFALAAPVGVFAATGEGSASVSAQGLKAASGVSAAEGGFPAAASGAISNAAAYVYKTVKNPEIGTTGGEWAIIGLARSAYDVPDAYYQTYYTNVEKFVKENKGILHDKKYTEYSRVILGLSAAGYDPRDIGGYDLTLALGDFENTIWQGINGPVWALIALDSMNYPIPQNSEAKTQASRELYVDEILKRQLPGGGWNLTAGAGGAPVADEAMDPDLTGMTLQALAKYQTNPKVKAAIEKALACLSASQDENGGYKGWGAVNSESVVQVLVALCELGIPLDDERFIKNGNSLVDNILTFMNADGSFRHMTSGNSGDSQMSTEQALYGLVAAQRAVNGRNSLYNMSDAVRRGSFAALTPQTGAGLPGKHADVKPMSINSVDKTFDDVKNHPNQRAIEALASRGIINGKTGSSFEPDATMSRAEFAAIVTRGLGLTGGNSSVFSDVPADAWYAGSVGCAYYYEIVTGVSDTAFNPTGTITRQEAAVMTVRAAKLAGLDTALDETTTRDTLAQFGDYTTAADWARASLAFCYGNGLIDDTEFDIRPKDAVKRCEIAEILYRTLSASNLL
ncbi:MAG: S-layer homology domain-containing protein [Clostridiales Family XIII bacterium]|nr:S-layer homology domain-containing protein [Clostridiales Family XIII bacterium]